VVNEILRLTTRKSWSQYSAALGVRSCISLALSSVRACPAVTPAKGVLPRGNELTHSPSACTGHRPAERESHQHPS
jgi:hypothetical protein